MRHLEKGRVVIFAAGTGNPFFTTDTAAALRAAEIHAEIILMAKNGVEGVYSADPARRPGGRVHPGDHAHGGDRAAPAVMDATALALCMDNRMPIKVFNMDDDSGLGADNLRRARRNTRVHIRRRGRWQLRELIDELLKDATRADGEIGRDGAARVLDRAHRARERRAAGPRHRRLLRCMTPLNQLSTISAPEARLLTVQPYDKSSIKAIEKAINESDVGLTPSNDGNVIRLSIPELTEERRRELVKVVRNLAEEGRVSIRNVRRDTMQHLRELKAEGEASSDDEHRAEVELQKLTDERIGELDEVLKGKEEEILAV